MDKKLIPLMLAILGFESIELKDNKASFSEDQVNSIKSYFKDQFGKDMELNGLKIVDGYATMSKEAILNIENAIASQIAEFSIAKSVQEKTDTDAKAKADAKVKADSDVKAKAEEDAKAKTDADTKAKTDVDAKAKEAKEAQELEALKKRNQELEAEVKKLGSQEDVASVITIKTDGLSTPKKIDMFTKADDKSFWNRAALLKVTGRHSEAAMLVGASEVDLDHVNTLLGAYFRQAHPEIQDFLVKDENLDAIFPPYGTGIKDELVVTDLFTGEFLQAYNKEWTEKGKFEFQAEKIKVRDYKVDHRFKATEIREFITSWLAPMTQGTDPFQESFIAFLSKKMAQKINLEKRKALIQGVYLQSPDGVAGPVLQSINGILKSLQSIREAYRIKPFSLGYWNTTLTSDQHIYKLIAKGTNMIPREIRDNATKIQVLTSKDGKDAVDLYKEALAKNTDLTDANVLKIPDYIEVVGVPHWNSQVLVWQIPGNIRQFYRQQNEDNKFYTQKEKRDTIVFMDGAAGISPIKTGYQYSSVTDQTYENQIIFMSEELEDYTYIEAIADDVTPSVAVHNCLKLGENTVATAITGIDDAVDGQLIYLLGDAASDENPATVADGATFLLESDWEAIRGNRLVLKKVGTKFIEIDRSGNLDDPNVIEIAADDTTPSLDGGSEFITSADNTGATAITDFDDGVADKVYTIHGGGGDDASTIADDLATIILVGAAWTAADGAWIKFYYTKSGIFKEIGRSA